MLNRESLRYNRIYSTVYLHDEWNGDSIMLSVKSRLCQRIVGMSSFLCDFGAKVQYVGIFFGPVNYVNLCFLVSVRCILF